MTQETFALLETYMLRCMEDSAHDPEHIYRVLYYALDIAKTHPEADLDLLTAACLLHDIGRKEQYENPKVCHAIAGGEKAFSFLIDNGFDPQWAGRVRDCIQTHRYRQNRPPESLEAKILFDADKLDVCGATGIARTLLYQGKTDCPLYTRLPDGQVSDGQGDSQPSFFQEYHFKLKGLSQRFYTQRGAELARQRQAAADAFYRQLYEEVSPLYRQGRQGLAALLTEE